MVPHQPSRRRHRLEWLAKRAQGPAPAKYLAQPGRTALAVLAVLVLAAPAWAGASACVHAAVGAALRVAVSTSAATVLSLHHDRVSDPGSSGHATIDRLLTTLTQPTAHAPGILYKHDVTAAWLHAGGAGAFDGLLAPLVSIIAVPLLALAALLAYLNLAIGIVDHLYMRLPARAEAKLSRAARCRGEGVGSKRTSRWPLAALRLLAICVVLAFLAPAAAVTAGSAPAAGGGAGAPLTLLTAMGAAMEAARALPPRTGSAAALRSPGVGLSAGAGLPAGVGSAAGAGSPSGAGSVGAGPSAGGVW